MQARHVLCAALLILHCTISNADEEEELPPLELLGFIADFSDEQGWVDPQDIEDIFDLKEPATDKAEEKTQLETQQQTVGKGEDSE